MRLWWWAKRTSRERERERKSREGRTTLAWFLATSSNGELAQVSVTCKTVVSLRSSPLGASGEEERLRLGDRSSTLMTLINVYIINRSRVVFRRELSGMERKGILGHPGKKILLLCAQPCTVSSCYWPSGPRVSTYTYVGTYEWKFIKGAVYMIQEWLAFRIDFRSRMKLRCIHMIKPNRSTKGVLARVFFAPAIFNPAERSPFLVNMKPE